MSFFGFPQNDLEQDKRAFLDASAQPPATNKYQWGEESYDGLGDALQEGNDELNEETFGDIGDVGKDFDFSNPALPGFDHTFKTESQVHKQQALQAEDKLAEPSQPPRSTSLSLEALWDDKSPFSVLPRTTNGTGRSTGQLRASPLATQTFSPFSNDTASVPSQQPLAHGIHQNGVRTLQEIEAEMRSAQQVRLTEQLQQQLQRQLLQRQEEERLFLQQQQEQELQRQRLQYQQEQQQQLHLQRLIQQQLQQRELQHIRTPPRMLPTTQSPRFFEQQQRQALLMQQQDQHLQELQEQLRLEEMERQMISRFSQQVQINPNLDSLRQHPAMSDLQVAHAMQHLQSDRRQRSQSPAVRVPQYTSDVSSLHNPQNIQMQQRLLSELAQAEFMRDVQGAAPLSQVEQEALRAEAMRKILEAERMEDKRRRKAAKLAHMSRYNDLMTQSDKDFITRIQVSQLVTQDPYADDFYAQVYSAILRSRMGLQSQDERVLKFGSSGGIGLGISPKGSTRRPSAMQRMEQQVERIVANARRREEEKGLHALQNLQGALGKTSGRSYKAAPRQLLQVDDNSTPNLSPAHAAISKDSVQKSGAAQEAAKLGREALGSAADTDNLIRREPLSQRRVLVILEHLYDMVLKVESLRRDQPPPEDETAQSWQTEYDGLVDQLWEGLQIMVPLETSDPHPFISLLMPAKGKRMLPRLTRHLSHQRMLTLLTLLVACFHQLDVITQAPLLDTITESRERTESERQTQAFLGSVLQSILPVVAKAGLRLVTGLLSLLMDRGHVASIAQTKPGLALLTLFLSRVEVIKQSLAGAASDVTELPSPEDAQQWQNMFDHLFTLLAPYLPLLFPSIRVPALLTSSTPETADYLVDQPVWQFLAALALHAAADQHHVLVSALREKILDDVATIKKAWAAGDPEWETRLTNVNLFLKAVGIDSAQVLAL
ncbi:hypothetical protein AX16_010407 [Volvariella volvacea WC 439]|nr:hypothetical protein AX16_010407 [Volvariella volvacea WC 439]